MKRTAFTSLIGGLILAMTGCNTMESTGGKMATEKSLYDRLDGKPVKGELAKVFVMGKQEGWGNTVPEHLKT